MLTAPARPGRAPGVTAHPGGFVVLAAEVRAGGQPAGKESD